MIKTIFAIALLFSCLTALSQKPPSEKEMYKKALLSNTSSAWNEYLEAYPNGKHSKEALDNGLELIWVEVGQMNDINSYKRYVKLFPNSPNIDEAKRKIEELTWIKTQEEGLFSGYHNFIKDYPTGFYNQQAQEYIKSHLLNVPQLTGQELDLINEEIANIITPFELSDLYSNLLGNSQREYAGAITSSFKFQEVLIEQVEIPKKADDLFGEKVTLERKSEIVDVFYDKVHQLRIYYPSGSSEKYNISLQFSEVLIRNYQNTGKSKIIFSIDGKLYDMDNCQ